MAPVDPVEQLRFQLLGIQSLICVMIGASGPGAHAWAMAFWLPALCLFLPSAILIIRLAVPERCVPWLATLDTSALLVMTSLGHEFGMVPTLGAVAILLLVSLAATLGKRLIMTLILAWTAGLTLGQQDLLRLEHLLLVPLGALLMTNQSIREQGLGFESSGALAAEGGPPPERDALTGLPTRVEFLQHVARAIRWKRRNPAGQFAVFFIDLDNFKPINDHFGHQVGDVVLQRVAKRLQARLKSLDVAARYGGDEFVLLLNEIEGEKDMAGVAERLIGAIREPMDLGQLVSVGASIGIALSSSLYHSPEDLIKDADAAMYRAKRSGKNHFAFSVQHRDVPASELKGRLRKLAHAWFD
jgi:diguanylate cyclase (GGDEF)-like protein